MAILWNAKQLGGTVPLSEMINFLFLPTGALLIERPADIEEGLVTYCILVNPNNGSKMTQLKCF